MRTEPFKIVETFKTHKEQTLAFNLFLVRLPSNVALLIKIK